MTADSTNLPFVPARAAALEQLHASASIIQNYAADRNTAAGMTTTRLSPYLRRRLLLEEEVIAFARSVGSFGRVEKFVQEVVWRTYWKGWLQARPGVWDAYLNRLALLDETLPAAD